MEEKKSHRPSPQPVPLTSPSLPYPMPRDSVQGVGCRPNNSGHRLAVTGGLCAQPSMCFCLLGASRQWRSKAPTEGVREHAVLGRHPSLEIWREMQSFQLGLPTLTQTHPRGFPQSEASRLVSPGCTNKLPHTLRSPHSRISLTEIVNLIQYLLSP